MRGPRRVALVLVATVITVLGAPLDATTKSLSLHAKATPSVTGEDDGSGEDHGELSPSPSRPDPKYLEWASDSGLLSCTAYSTTQEKTIFLGSFYKEDVANKNKGVSPGLAASTLSCQPDHLVQCFYTGEDGRCVSCC